MPKINNTRKQKAKRLLDLVRRGPSIAPMKAAMQKDVIDEFDAQYRRWSESWVIPLLEELVPELKK